MFDAAIAANARRTTFVLIRPDLLNIFSVHLQIVLDK